MGPMRVGVAAWACGCRQQGRAIRTVTRRLHTGPPFNILFFGTDAFAVETLAALHTNRQERDQGGCVVNKLHVVSTSDTSVVARFAKKKELPLLSWPPALSDLERYDLGVLVSFGRLVPRRVIAKLPHGILNVHPSLLPRWRGASPIMHTVLNRDPQTGVSVMSIQPHRFDTGPIVRQTTMPVPEGVTAQSLADTLATEGAKLLVNTLHAMPGILDTAAPQSEEGATYAHKVTATMATINWQQHSSHQIQQQYRALAHMFPLRSTWNGQTVKLTDMLLDTPDDFEPSPLALCRNSEQVMSHGAGTVLYDPDLSALCVKCQEGWVAFQSVVLKKKMSAADFYNGYLSKDKFSYVCFQSGHNGLFGQEYTQWIRQPKGHVS